MAGLCFIQRFTYWHKKRRLGVIVYPWFWQTGVSCSNERKGKLSL